MTAPRRGRGRARLLAACALTLGVVLAGCGVAATEPPAAETPEATPEPVFQPVLAATTPTAEPEPLHPDEVDDALAAVICWYEDPQLARECLPPGEETLSALQRIALSGDDRFIAPLVDMLWLEVGWERWVREALERLSGERFATAADWYGWVLRERPSLPQGYGAWKGRLLAIIDERFTELIREPGEGPVGPESLIWAHVGPGDVPPLVSPSTVHQLEEQYLATSDVVYGVVVHGEARAYPERIVAWHGVVHDEVSGSGIVLLHCPACGGAAAFASAASDGNAYTFRTSGLVHESRRLFFDEDTGSLWDAVSGRAVHGPLAEEGVSLRPIDSLQTTWGEWSARYPGTRVLSLETGHVRDYSEGAAMSLALEAEGPLFPMSAVDDRMEPKQRVLGVEVNGSRRAYDLAALEQARLVNDVLGGQSIAIVSAGPGRGATVYEAYDVTFESLRGFGDDRELIDSDGIRWFVDDERLLNVRNSHVRRAIPSQSWWWFAWSGAFPETTTWSP